MGRNTSRPSWLTLERQKRYAVARGQLSFITVSELSADRSAALAPVELERKRSDTTFDPVISSDLSRFFRIFSWTFEPRARS